MIQPIIIAVLLMLSFGCSSLPKKNLSSIRGKIAAHFRLFEEEVVELRDKGLNNNKIIKVLTISQGSYLTREEILNMMEGGKSLQEIAEEIGIEPDTLQDIADRIEEQLSDY